MYSTQMGWRKVRQFAQRWNGLFWSSVASLPCGICSIAVSLRCCYCCEISVECFLPVREQAVVIHKACKITPWSICCNYRKLPNFGVVLVSSVELMPYFPFCFLKERCNVLGVRCISDVEMYFFDKLFFDNIVLVLQYFYYIVIELL